ncbi:hypothetical protein FRC08_001246 [Ceratobasidium sp. 394]|nr:hypothetical protein FRC08_001246 [Ceratobasidium sp. 394]
MGDPGPSQGSSASSIFGAPLHFHIHSAIPPKLKADLVRLIEAHGGIIHKRLIDLHHPFYALVHPRSPKLAEYAAYVSTREPPTERGSVVPYSFVRASIAAHRVLRPAEFQSEPDASHAVWAPLALTRGSPRQAPGSGEGNARSTADQPEDDADGWGGLEPVTVHLHVTLARDERTSLAVKIAKAGGDTTPSMSAARVIIANEDHAEFAQLKKRCHTWQSWRNRYRKRQDYFDPIINDYAARRQHTGDGKGEYGYSRGKKRAVREDSPEPVSADREKRRRSSNEPSTRDQNASGTSTKDPRRKRPDPRERSSPQERPRASDTSAQRSNITTRLGHAPGDTADATLGLGGEAECTQSAAGTRMGSNESGPMDMPALDPDPDNNNVNDHAPMPGGGFDLSSPYYGYDDRDVHDRARDLGLSDYLAQGFTSTW